LYGGRLAEEMILGFEGVTTGASNDIERASAMARKMVTRWGLSEKMGPLLYGDDEAQYPGAATTKQYSDETSKTIDEEVRRIIDSCYARAKKILEDNIDILHAMKDALMEYETIDADQVDDLMSRRKVRPPRDWHDNDIGSGNTVTTAEKKLTDTKDKPIGGPAGEH
jgi:cell division protease FtsH